MGLIFNIQPSAWEVNHARPIQQAVIYQKLHDGDLPDTPMWRSLERRFDRNRELFTHWHPNISTMIIKSREVKLPCWIFELPKIDCRPVIPYVPPAPIPNPSLPSVPEPSSFVLLSFTLLLTLLIRK